MSAAAQKSSEVKKQLDEHYKQAMHFKEISLFGESIGELDKVIKLAKQYDFQEERIRASISKAELFRKVENFDRGIALLSKLNGSEKYPKLHVQKLGRLAALYAENADFSTDVQRDSINAFVQEGIRISTRLGLKEEEASLRNELGFSQSRSRRFDVALKNLQKATTLYRELGDEENEVGVLINIFDMYV